MDTNARTSCLLSLLEQQMKPNVVESFDLKIDWSAQTILPIEFRGREEALPYDQVHGIVLGGGVAANVKYRQAPSR